MYSSQHSSSLSVKGMTKPTRRNCAIYFHIHGHGTQNPTCDTKVAASSKQPFHGHCYMDNCGKSRASTSAKTRLCRRVVFTRYRTHPSRFGAFAKHTVVCCRPSSRPCCRVPRQLPAPGRGQCDLQRQRGTRPKSGRWLGEA